MTEIQSLARGLRILDFVIDANRAVSITELAEQLETDKSTASRLVRTLVNSDYLQQDTATRRYVIGRRLHKVSWHIVNRLPVRETAHPYLVRLVRDTGECAHTAVYSDGKALVIDDVEGEATLRVAGQTGRRIPLHCTAVGKALLADLDVPIPMDLPARTPQTITDPDHLRAHLEEICRRGYAVDDEENDPGVRCIAAPVRDSTGIIIATMGISGPTVRVTPDRIDDLAQVVMQAARELSLELGSQANYADL
jgi:IclR family acetate operon transcriptional repressor